MDRRKKGFTLMELLITIGIIGVLVAISIPVYKSQIKSSREKACEGVRNSLGALVTEVYMATDGGQPGLDAVSNTYNELHGEYVCPDGGTLTYEVDATTDEVDIFCTKHHPCDINPGVKLEEAYTNVIATLGGNRYDSNTVGGTNVPKIVAELERQGIVLSNYNVNTWVIVKCDKLKTNYFIWSTYKATYTNDKGVEVNYISLPAIAYTSNGEYIVGLSNVRKSQFDGYSFALGAESNGFNPAGGRTFDNLSEAQAYYSTLSAVKQ